MNASLAKHGQCFPDLVLDRADVYTNLGYDDLAAFDAFVAYTLCQKALTDEFVTDLEARELDGSPWKPSPRSVVILKLRALRLLVNGLTRLGATKDAAIFRADYNSALTEEDGEQLVELSNGTKQAHFGFSRREMYPWSAHELSRNSPDAVGEINTYLSTISETIEAKVTALPAFNHNGLATEEVSLQLGLFAKQDLLPGQLVLNEKSLLTAIRPFEDAICDACGQELDGIPFEAIRQCDGDDCDVTFCSEDCKTRAVKEYHQPLTEDMDSEEDTEEDDTQSATGETESDPAQDENQASVESPSTHRAFFCGNQDLTLIGRPTNTTTPEWDLYFLLLTRAIAMSLTQNIHPLELIETKYLWGDFHPPSNTTSPHLDTHPHTLPFSVTHNLQYTLDFFATLSLTCPSATPYSPHWLKTFDFWILQTLFAKFRGVANATQSTFDGRPEIASVHAGWSLANHSCAPNVKWAPKGVRQLIVRTAEERTWDADAKWDGIGKGEEVVSHYTDVRLPVEERRERLRMVLGGQCRCERCLTEAGNAQTDPS